jgi:hypothetical protein
LKEEIFQVADGYRASGDVKPVFTFSGDLNVLRVSCKIIDIIAKVDKISNDRISMAIFDSAVEVAKSLGVRDEQGGSRIWGLTGRGSLRYIAEAQLFQESQKHTGYLSMSIKGKVREVLIAGEGGAYTDFYTDEVIQNVLRRRRFFVTSAGHIGVGPSSTDEGCGDAVCVIKGCNFPILLRREKGHYLLVGEAFGKLV